MDAGNKPRQTWSTEILNSENSRGSSEFQPSLSRLVACIHQNHQKSLFIRKRFSLRQTIIEDITFGLVKMYVTPNRFAWTIFILGLALNYTDKLLVFRWVQIVLLLLLICFYSAMKEIS